MSNKNKTQEQTEQELPVETPETPVDPKPVMTRIYTWALSVLPKDVHAGITEAYNRVIRDAGNFVRNGNRTAFNLDEEAFASAAMEYTPEGRIFNFSNMDGRRVVDIIRVGLMELATGVFQPKPRKDLDKNGQPKMDTQKTARERWVKGLGFDKQKVGGGSRWQLTIPKPGVEELIRDIELMVPVVFSGTEQTIPTTKQVAFVEPAELLSKTFYTTLPDPDHKNVSTADVDAALQYVTLKIKAGCQLKSNDKTGLPRIAQRYYALYEQRIAAEQKKDDAAA